MIYIIDKSEKYLRILGCEFFLKNQKRLMIVYKNKRYLKDKMFINDIKGDLISIKIVFFENIIDRGCMFKDCVSLLTCVQNIKTKTICKYFPKLKVKEGIIINCDYLKLFGNFPENNTNSEKNDNMSENSISFSKNFDTSKSTTNNYSEKESPNEIKKENCSLKYYIYANEENKEGYFKDESKISEDMKNFINISNSSFQFWKNNINIKIFENKSFYKMFYNCSSLITLPDLSKWNTDKVFKMDGMFYNCNKIYSLPDISRWNTENCISMSHLFYNCSSLSSLPDLSKWNTKNVKDMSGMFSFCSSLKFLPDISNWKTHNVENMSGIFSNC